MYRHESRGRESFVHRWFCVKPSVMTGLLPTFFCDILSAKEAAMLVVITTGLGNQQYGMEKIEEALGKVPRVLLEPGFLVALSDDTDVKRLLEQLGPGFSVHSVGNRIELMTARHR